MDGTGLDPKAFAKLVVQELVNDTNFKDLIRDLIKTVVSQVTDEKLKQVNDRLQEIETRCEKAEGRVFELENLHVSLADEYQNVVGNLVNRMNLADMAIVDTQQYSRRNCIVITGVPETPEKKDANGKKIPEDTDQLVRDMIKEGLGIEVKKEEIDRTHRATRTKPRGGKPRAIIAKFATYNTRHKIIKDRRKLKGKGLGIFELLTKQNQVTLEKAKEMVKQVPRLKAAWTWDGNVTILVDCDGKGTEKRFIVKTIWDVTQLAKRYGNK